MTSIQLNEIYSWFNSYVDSYYPKESSARDMVGLKLKHSRLVAENCRNISRELGWDDNSCLLGEALGILHDTGRFSQFKEYGTFNDPGSINHGERGYQVVNDTDVLDEIEEVERLAILAGIRYHNAHKIPSNDIVPESNIPFIKLIRDADKLDIFRVFVEEIQSHHIDEHLRTVLDADTKTLFSEAAVNDIKNKQVVKYVNVQSSVDFHLLRLSWVFDINYEPTFNRLRDKRLFENIIDMLPKHDTLKEAIGVIEAHLEQRVS